MLLPHAGVDILALEPFSLVRTLLKDNRCELIGQETRLPPLDFPGKKIIEGSASITNKSATWTGFQKEEEILEKQIYIYIYFFFQINEKDLLYWLDWTSEIIYRRWSIHRFNFDRIIEKI